jgi:hypothetical protein
MINQNSSDFEVDIDEESKGHDPEEVVSKQLRRKLFRAIK